MQHTCLRSIRLLSLLHKLPNRPFSSLSSPSSFFPFSSRNRFGTDLSLAKATTSSTTPSKEAQILHTYQTQEDTIAAIATGPFILTSLELLVKLSGFQQSAIAIIRISGQEAVPIAHQIFRPRSFPSSEWKPLSHRVYVGDAVNPNQDILDEVLCLVFLSPKSYTGEDVVELHCHGGQVCVQRVMSACIEAGVRPAFPGEFTLRAFLNGKMDLSQAESVQQLVEARTIGAADSALAGLKGGIGQTIQKMRNTSLELLAELEARLDFDEDMPEFNTPHFTKQIHDLQKTVESCLKTASHGRFMRNGIQIAIVGRPNVGKSSLMNAWSGIDKAIVTDIPGTTRDVVESGDLTLSMQCVILPVDVVINGIPVKLLDTAGIREGLDTVESMGIERARTIARKADVILMVMDLSQGWTEQDMSVFDSLWSNKLSRKEKVLAPSVLIANKKDRTKQQAMPSLPLVVSETFESIVLTSATKNEGIGDIGAAVLSLIGESNIQIGGNAWAVNERQSEALFRTHDALRQLHENIENDLPMDCWTVDLRDALLSLGEVNGEDLKEELLDNIFSRFCLGK